MRRPNSNGIQIKIRKSEISGSRQLAGPDSAAPDRHAALAGKQAHAGVIYGACQWTDGRPRWRPKQSEERERRALERLPLVCSPSAQPRQPRTTVNQRDGVWRQEAGLCVSLAEVIHHQAPQRWR